MAREVVLSHHARWRIVRRQLDEAVVLRVAREPEQVIEVRLGREIRQRRLAVARGKPKILVRVVVDVGAERDVVVTAYKTSKVERYWRAP